MVSEARDGQAAPPSAEPVAPAPATCAGLRKRLCAALAPSSSKAAIYALALLQSACGVALIVTAANDLGQAPAPGSDAAGAASRRCSLGADPSDASPCNYSIALGAVGLAGSLALMGLLVVDYAGRVAKRAAEVAATEVRPRRPLAGRRAAASLLGRAGRRRLPAGRRARAGRRRVALLNAHPRRRQRRRRLRRRPPSSGPRPGRWVCCISGVQGL